MFKKIALLFLELENTKFTKKKNKYYKENKDKYSI